VTIKREKQLDQNKKHSTEERRLNSQVMVNTKTIRVPHLGGIDAAYQMPREYDPAKPTVVLINAFTTSSELYRDQFNDASLTDKMNLVAIELLGHGQTRTAREHWTYWDTAEMNLQVLDALKIDRAFVLGTSQGGWVTVQMALLRPEKVTSFLWIKRLNGWRLTCDTPSDSGYHPNGNLHGL
jgi:pimeloyl-ACP methyl ester carboxylesterase